MAESPPKGGLSAFKGSRETAPEGGASGQDVVELRRELLARLLEFALDV
jgi:hypothetical protein